MKTQRPTAAVDRRASRKRRYGVAQLLETEWIGGGDFSPDESKLLYASDRSGVFNAHVFELAGSGSAPLTNSRDDNIFPISFFPRDERILYHQDRGGNEIYHLYLRDLDGNGRDLTADDGRRAVFHGWSFDERSFFYQSNLRDPRFLDLYEVSVETLEARVVFENTDFELGPVSPDGRYLALNRLVDNRDSNIHLFDRKTGRTTLLTPHEGAAQFSAVAFSLNSKGLFCTSDLGDEFKGLLEIELTSGRLEPIARADWDVVWAGVSRSRRYLYWGLNVDGETVVSILDRASNERLDLTSWPRGDTDSLKFSPSDRRLRFYHSSPRSPRNLYVYDLEKAELTRLTHTLGPQVDERSLIDAEVVRYTSFDGVEIPALLMRPRCKPGQKAPALIEAHGGPGGQARAAYDELCQCLARQGYAILRVNFRGSSGYGKSFSRLGERRHGQDDLKDCIWAKRYLQSLDFVDPDRIGILGGSYGGYLVLAALAFTPGEFEAGVDLFGVANWLHVLRSTPPWWTALRGMLFAEIGDPEKDEEYLKGISPLFQAGNIVEPLLVLQGANDAKVPRSESDQIVEAAGRNGAPVELLVFDDEGHGFRKKQNRIEGYEAISRFLDEHLKSPAAKGDDAG